MNALALMKILQAALGLTNALRIWGINYREVQDAQDAAKAKGEELSDETLQGFIDQAQAAIDKL
ncbi:hypothetical protein LCGC14_2292420 [marine sediment metagenome]|uniref:Uncharacterized protein n=1 Tax=marine sediment metagenome TaxID=412755 RepID=A0A0F9FKX5_9ZZZZ